MKQRKRGATFGVWWDLRRFHVMEQQAYLIAKRTGWQHGLVQVTEPNLTVLWPW